MTAEWKDASGTTSTIPATDIKKVSDKELQVNLIPGTTAGEGTLVLISAIGLRASEKITVK
jgi:hypothetical protein